MTLTQQIVALIGYLADETDNPGHPCPTTSEAEALTQLTEITTNLIDSLANAWGFVLQVYPDDTLSLDLRDKIAGLATVGNEADMRARGWSQNDDGAWCAPRQA